ncbi:cellulose 1,4-beta-cellobiosidase [Dyadobacter sp. UC 10]|nr:cellulose 1,4-beta-cellobiosidase [Dyadobacter sp. UC 10]
MWRGDISRFDELRFFIKSNKPLQTTSIRFTTFYAQGKWVSLAPYLPAGTLIGTDYQEVVIPIDSLKTTGYDLSSVDYLEFATSGASGTLFYIDDILLTDITSPTISAQPLSYQVIRLAVDERFDTTGCYQTSSYEMSSTTDPEYQPAKNPLRVGRHLRVAGLAPISGTPLIQSELFLVFEKPFENGIEYRLQAENLKDPAGNMTSLDTSFTFSDQVKLGNVKLNQVGYLPESPKLGKLGNFLGDAWFLPIDQLNSPDFQVLDGADNVKFSGKSSFLKSDSAFSGEMVFELDFSAFKTPGTYYLYVPGYGRSEEFRISADVYNGTYFHTARALYFQRSGALSQENAFEWARNGLPSTAAEIHSSHSSSNLFSATDYPPGSSIPMQGGWLDAGDYGRYVPTAASALFILFTAVELYPEKFPDNHLNIPESGNKIPDILDEAKYETTWLKSMQAPDGGVYFRVTPAIWSTGMPEDESNTLYVSVKTTQSTALFAAAMAMAYRNLKPYYPAHADSCLALAEKAWDFLQAHPEASAPVVTPGISAGPYPDPEDRDNRAWAAAELYKSTGNAQYQAEFLAYYAQIPHEFQATMSWQQHTFKAAWAYATSKFPTDAAVVTEFKNSLETILIPEYNNRTMSVHAYHGAYHPFKGYIGYGTFAMAQSYAFDYVLFSYLLGQPALLDFAKMQLDIPLGNNPLSLTFITGTGNNSPKYPLHWSTVADHFPNPVPGLPVFGPAASLVMNRPSSFAIQDSLNRYPYGFKKEDPYPVLRRYTDAREAVEMSEFTVQEIAVTAAVFAFFSAVVNEALPVKLSAFNAAADACKVLLQWTTSEEINAGYFAVERSADARNFSEIGRIAATGNSRLSNNYTFADSLPGAKNYYRLRQIDLDGTSEYSLIRFAEGPCAESSLILKHIGRNHYQIQIKEPNQMPVRELTGHIYHITGFEKRTFRIPKNGFADLNCAGFGPGVYILKVLDNRKEEFFTGKLLIY